MAGTGPSNSGDLELFAKFSALTVALFHRLACSSLSMKSAEKRLSKLIKMGLISPHPLLGNRVFYALTQKGRQALGLSRLRKPLGPHAIMRAISHAAFVTMTGARIMPKEEVEKKFAQVFFGTEKWPSGIPSAFCYTEQSAEGFTFRCIIWDMGKAIRRLHKMIEKYFRRLEAYSVMRQLLQSGNYRFVVLTGHEQKAQRITRLRLPHPVQAVVVPELGDMLRGS